MTRSQAKETLKMLKDKIINTYEDTEDPEDMEDEDEKLIYAIDFALADMDSLQDILYITDGISVD